MSKNKETTFELIRHINKYTTFGFGWVSRRKSAPKSLSYTYTTLISLFFASHPRSTPLRRILARHILHV